MLAVAMKDLLIGALAKNDEMWAIQAYPLEHAINRFSSQTVEKRAIKHDAVVSNQDDVPSVISTGITEFTDS